MFLLGISDTSRDEAGEPSLPVILPHFERQGFHCGGPQAVQADRRKHSRSLVIEPVEIAISERVLPPLPHQPRRRPGEPVKNNALTVPDYERHPDQCQLRKPRSPVLGAPSLTISDWPLGILSLSTDFQTGRKEPVPVHVFT